MTLHDRLKEIIDQHDNQLQRWFRGNAEDPTPDTITAIIAAFTERLPEGKERIEWHHLVDSYYRNGWNAYRQEVLRIMTP